MLVAVKTNPALWAQIKRKWLQSDKGGVAGKWNARKAMLAVQEYKRRGGSYIGPRSPANSLKKWEREDWGYIDGDTAGRYLPAAVRKKLTPAEKKQENARKRGKTGKWVPYTSSVNEKMRRAGIYGPGISAKPKTAKPKAAKPKAAKPKATKPKAAKPKATKPKAAKPKAAKPKTAKPKTAKPKSAKPKAAKPKNTKPKAAKSKAAKPKAAKPKAAKPKNTKPKTVKPKARPLKG